MNILIAEDERSLRLALEEELREAGFTVSAVADGEEAVERLKAGEFDLVICDLVMGGIDGMDVLRFVQEHSPATQFVLMTAHATIQSAIEILKNGAVDYLRKPFEMEQLMQVIRHVKETIRLRKESRIDSRPGELDHHFGQLLGRSMAMREVFGLASAVADSESTVLIHGETGTGKNVLAEAIHYQSRRSNHPLVTVSCASLSREILESELFGHEKGSFTGAFRQKKGRFELAHKGTLFLDEIDDIPMETQVKLLNFTQTGKFERVGGEDTLHADVRILAATKKDLAKQVEKGLFRQDLYYRLHVLQIRIPPLRERPEDIPLLTQHFLRKYSPDRNLELSKEILGILLKHAWEGNVRELEHVVERLVLLNKDGKIHRSALPPGLVDAAMRGGDFDWGQSSMHEFLDQTERRILCEALAKGKGNKREAASLLKIPLPTLKSKLEKFGLSHWEEGDSHHPAHDEQTIAEDARGPAEF